MNTVITIDKAGRLVIPKSLREELHLEAGDALELESAGEEITLRPVRSKSTLVKKQGVWVFEGGRAPISAETTNDVLEQIREERDLQSLGKSV